MNINLLDNDNLSLLRQTIDDAKNIVICCHKSPDGDALGSSLAWAEYLRTKGKVSQIIVPDAWPDFLQWMPNTEKVIRFDKHREKSIEVLQAADTIFCLDFNDSGRLNFMQEEFEKIKARRVMIDHHLSPVMPTELCLSFPDMSSTSEIVFRLVWQLGDYDAMTKHFAVPIYVGMMTDTGGFSYSSSSPEIYFIISQLLTKHFDKDKIYRKVYSNYSTWCVRMRGYMMFQKLNVLEEAHAAYFTITRDDMHRFHFVKGDSEGLVNEPLRIKGMRLSISLREDTEVDNKIWVSMRSVDNYTCNNIAEKFYNGGGHPNAAGGHLDCSIEEAEVITRKAIKWFAENNQMINQ